MRGTTALATLAIVAILAVMPVVPIIAIVTVVPVAEAVLVVAAVAFEARLMLLMLMLAHLRLHVGLDIALVALVVAELVASIHRVEPITGNAAVHTLATGAHLLIAEGHDDAIVVLGMLEVVLGQHRIARRRRVACERHVFLGDVRRGSADLYVRTRAFEAAREWALSLAVTAAAPAVLLSLPHWLHSQS
jgi:hypothetical protein